MRCPTLNELPPPPSGRSGWPWTEESRRLPDTDPDGCPWPAVSVVTPSYNQGQFIEGTIRSVLLQGYPNLEYIVLDGGSTDNTLDIIKKYAPWLRHWVSEPDSGQSDAINRGLRMASGLFATWINSDDMLCINALCEHASRIGFTTNVVYVGKCAYMDVSGQVARMHRARVNSFDDLVRVGKIWRAGGNIVQPEVLFPRQLAVAVGGLDANNHNAMDYELWGKFFLAGARFQYTEVPFGMFRMHAGQKTADGLRQTRSLLGAAAKLLTQADWLSAQARNEILADLETYWRAYKKEAWRSSGRLARIGLPPVVVTCLRNLRTRCQEVMAYLNSVGSAT